MKWLNSFGIHFGNLTCFTQRNTEYCKIQKKCNMKKAIMNFTPIMWAQWNSITLFFKSTVVTINNNSTHSILLTIRIQGLMALINFISFWWPVPFRNSSLSFQMDNNKKNNQSENFSKWHIIQGKILSKYNQSNMK